MRNPLSALQSWVSFQALSADEKLDLGFALADWLGHDFDAETPVGDAELPAVLHYWSKALFVAVPGGTFQMGFSEDDLEAALQYLEQSRIEGMLTQLGERCTPVRQVSVRPFLLTATPLTPQQIFDLTHNSEHKAEMRPDGVARFMADASDFRLPSEAELEWVIREAGAVHFAYDGGRIYSETGRWPRTSRWGFEHLTFPTWVSDSWHGDYEGAPSDSRAWDPAPEPQMFRGDLPFGPDQVPSALIAALAPWRCKWEPAQELEVGVRLAMTLELD